MSSYATRQSSGNCGQCGQRPPRVGFRLCDLCGERNRERQSRRHGEMSSTPHVTKNGSIYATSHKAPDLVPAPAHPRPRVTHRLWIAGEGWMDFTVVWDGRDGLLPDANRPKVRRQGLRRARDHLPAVHL